MLEVRRGDGTYVRATSEISGAAQRMYQDHTQVHILEVRVGLDTQAARLAARHATADDVAAMRELLAGRRAAWLAGDYAGWARADWDFHVLVAQASGNPLLHELYVSFGAVFHADLLRQQRRGGFNGLPHEGHGELVDAIEAHDERAAVDSVNRNLNSCAEWLQCALAAAGPQRPLALHDRPVKTFLGRCISPCLAPRTITQPAKTGMAHCRIFSCCCAERSSSEAPGFGSVAPSAPSAASLSTLAPCRPAYRVTAAPARVTTDL